MEKMRSKGERFWVLALVTLACALGASLSAGPALGQSEEQPAEQAAPPALEMDQEPSAEIEEILQDEESMLAGEGYYYDPGSRRDPFKSLLDARDRPFLRGPRPEGIPGLLVDEIDLSGIFLTSDGPVAQVRSADQDKSYLLRVGDQMYDGDVVSISGNEVVFKQIVDDPTALKPFREVVKKLNP
jgi:hypothetical protein